MDKNKNAQGQQKQGQQNQGQQGQGSKDRNWNDTSPSNTNREPAESGGQKSGNRGDMGPERGTGTQGERNSSGISNRGMDKSKEQADLPSRGSSDEDWSDQSER